MIRRGLGIPKFSDVDQIQARTTPIGRIDESNPSQVHILIPQKEEELSPVEIVVPVPYGLIPDPKSK